jgi:hypothetical protein
MFTPERKRHHNEKPPLPVAKISPLKNERVYVRRGDDFEIFELPSQRKTPPARGRNFASEK